MTLNGKVCICICRSARHTCVGFDKPLGQGRTGTDMLSQVMASSFRGNVYQRRASFAPVEHIPETISLSGCAYATDFGVRCTVVGHGIGGLHLVLY